MTRFLDSTLSVIEKGITDGVHPGAQLYVSRDHVTLADLALGEGLPGKALTTDTLALWLSATKPVVAVALAVLWERGLLGLDDPVALHVPEFAEGGKEAVTLRYLLTHTGGIRMLNTGWPEASWADIVSRICRRKLEPGWVPGKKAGYLLTSSWFILGEVIRRVSGRAFSEFVREEVFEPLGMIDSWIGMPQGRFAAYGDRIGRSWNTEKAETRPFEWHECLRVCRPSPGGNGRGPIKELGRFYEMLLGKGKLPGGERLLTPQTVEALTARHRVGLLDHTFRHKMDWGLGFIHDSSHYGASDVPYAYGSRCSWRTFGHSGYRSTTGFCDPEVELVVAVAFNGLPDDAAHHARSRAVCDAIYEDLGL